MKRNFTGKSKSTLVVALIFLAAGLSSCSMFSQRSQQVNTSKGTSGDMVPREQYDDLLKKYDALVNSKHISNAETATAGTPDLNKPEILDALNNAKEGSLAETVNVFVTDDPKLKDMKMPQKNGLSTVSPQIEVPLNASAIEKEIGNIRKAQEFVAQNKFNKAMENLKPLEKSPVRHIRVNAKFLIGEILFKQQEYDLAMQIFEEIISMDAFSGITLRTLGRLIVCSEKLQLKEKQQRYHSLLHDFFES